jgi:haloalkane dehalogenase
VPAARPEWLPDTLYPFQSRYLRVGGATVHYVDEGSGPTLLLLHGNPTWSFLYREIIKGLRHDFRCVALDYPGFGLSAPPPGYGFTPAEHADVVERFVQQLDLTTVTMMVQDWGGPIGFAVATRHPDRFTRFVIGNTWAWPKSDLGTQVFSRLLGSPVGGYLIRRHNIFVERIVPSGVRRTPLSDAVMNAYRGPFPTPESRRPMQVFPREILGSRTFLADIAARLPQLRDRPALLCWPTKDFAFRDPERKRWEGLFPNHHTVVLEGAGHYIQEDAAPDIVAAIRECAFANP